jgi:tRNA(fMet)-specific endonuclease VapC
MMAGKFLLDTNIIVALFANDKAVQDRIAKETSIYVPAIVLGELYYGALKSSKVSSNVARVDKIASWSILDCDKNIAAEYGKAKAALAAKGRLIPENDIWIAAIALHHHLTVVTRDAHFSEVVGILIEKW